MDDALAFGEGPSATPRRYRLQPLAQMAGMTDREALLALKVSGTTYQKYRDEGLSRDVADRMAERLGFHPYEVWPDMVEDDLEDLADLPPEGQQCAAWGCPEWFIPSRVGGSKRWPPRFCSTRCRNRDKRRRQIGWVPPAEKVCAAPGCAALFVPAVKRPDQRFCSVRCRNREKARRYRGVPSVVMRRRELQRRYHREVKELIARRRERRQEDRGDSQAGEAA